MSLHHFVDLLGQPKVPLWERLDDAAGGDIPGCRPNPGRAVSGSASRFWDDACFTGSCRIDRQVLCFLGLSNCRGTCFTTISISRKCRGSCNCGQVPGNTMALEARLPQARFDAMLPCQPACHCTPTARGGLLCTRHWISAIPIVSFCGTPFHQIPSPLQTYRRRTAKTRLLERPIINFSKEWRISEELGSSVYVSRKHPESRVSFTTSYGSTCDE